MRSSDKQSNRERFPDIAKFVDELREIFGEVKVVELIEHEAMPSLPDVPGNTHGHQTRTKTTPL